MARLANRFAKTLVGWNSEVEAIEKGKGCTRHHKTVTYASAAFYAELYTAANKRGI
jgi:hypothetical protein